MIYELTHNTRYSYTHLISLSHHLMHLKPRDCPHQKCVSHSLSISPTPSNLNSHLDYFGNPSTFAIVETIHQEFSVTSKSTVNLQAQIIPEPNETPAWEIVRNLCRGEQIGQGLDASEFIYNSPLIQRSENFSDYAAPSFKPRQSLLEAVAHLTSRIHHDFTFDPTATTVATPLQEVFKSRRGVCQDFAQLEIACLRSMGLAARYVSGYLETVPPPGKRRLVGADASHAWVSFYCPGLGWIDVDPTNNLFPSSKHITIAWGRDYSDVSPIRGVILGNGNHTLKVGVDVVALPETS
ncbi:MAG: transglutaminase domain protein [Verrucomicrobiales bacterium]|nr:transglutaminase domain protein [Verrucomicrobiales bacterium]